MPEEIGNPKDFHWTLKCGYDRQAIICELLRKLMPHLEWQSTKSSETYDLMGFDKGSTRDNPKNPVYIECRYNAEDYRSEGVFINENKLRARSKYPFKNHRCLYIVIIQDTGVFWVDIPLETPKSEVVKRDPAEEMTGKPTQACRLFGFRRLCTWQRYMEEVDTQKSLLIIPEVKACE